MLDDARWTYQPVGVSHFGMKLSSSDVTKECTNCSPVALDMTMLSLSVLLILLLLPLLLLLLLSEHCYSFVAGERHERENAVWMELCWL